jgi:hypothetical protein
MTSQVAARDLLINQQRKTPIRGVSEHSNCCEDRGTDKRSDLGEGFSLSSESSSPAFTMNTYCRTLFVRRSQR